MRAYILDDEITAINNIRIILNEFIDKPVVEVVGSATNVAAAMKDIQLLKPDMVFLDVELYRESGFDFLDKIENREFEVIVVTAYDTYALDAYKHFAIGYIQKPIDIQDLKYALQKVAVIAEGKHAVKTTVAGSIVLSNKDNKTKVSFEDIVLLQAEGSYTYFLLTDRRVFLTSKNIKEYESVLPDTNFIRVHKEYIVNIKHIQQYKADRSPQLVMSNGTIVHVASRRKSDFLKFYYK